MADNSHPNYFNYLLSFVLGFIAISVAFICFDHTAVFLEMNSSYPMVALISWLVAFSLGFFMHYQFKQFLQNHVKNILLLLAFWLSIFISSIYFLFLASHFIPAATFAIFVITGSVMIFILIGILFESTVANSKASLQIVTFLFGMIGGLLISTFILLNRVVGSWLIFFDTCLLIGCVIVLMKNFLEEIVTSSLIIAILVVGFAVNIQASGSLKLRTEYRAINDLRFPTAAPHVSIGENLFSRLDLQTKNQYPYLPLIKQILDHNSKTKNQNVLVLGTGVYQFAKLDNSKIHFTYLDDAHNTLPSACTYLSILSKGNNLVVGKEHSLANQTRKFNVVIANVFPNNQAITPMLLSYQYLLEIRGVLSDDGVAIINALARPTLSDLYSKRVDNTIRAVFPSCMGIPLAYNNQLTNIIYVCQKSDEERDNTIYSSHV